MGGPKHLSDDGSVQAMRDKLNALNAARIGSSLN